MVRTSTAERYNYICPECGDGLKQDRKGRGFVAHASNPNCQFEKGQKDDDGSPSATASMTRQVPMPEYQLADGVRLCGYSERGIFNALLYEIGYSSDPVGKLAGLLSLVGFPYSQADFSQLRGAEVLIEQSLSDFGDADAVLLLHGDDWRSVMFVEGKVKSYQVGSWTVQGAWREFLSRKDGKLHSSNLFTQLWHKVRFVNALRRGGIPELDRGVAFPDCSTKTTRKLGNNQVVGNAARIIKKFVKDAHYIAVVPDSSENVAEFYANELPSGPPDDVAGWDITGWGYLTWAQVEAFCRGNGLLNTIRVFDFNRGQIY